MTAPASTTTMSEVLHGRGLFLAVAIDFASRCRNSGLPVFLIEPLARRLVADDPFRRGVGHRALTALSQHSLRCVGTLTRAIPPSSNRVRPGLAIFDHRSTNWNGTGRHRS